MEVKLKREFDFYIGHQNELVEKYRDKYIVIKDDNVLGSYANVQEAIKETIRTEPLGTFLIQKCTPGETDYTQTFHSRVVF